MPITSEMTRLDIPLDHSKEEPGRLQPKAVQASREKVSGVLMRMLPERRKTLRLMEQSDRQGHLSYMAHSLENGDVKAVVKIKLPPAGEKTFEFELTFMDLADFSRLKERMWDTLYQDYVSRAGGFGQYDILRVDEMVRDILNTFNSPNVE